MNFRQIRFSETHRAEGINRKHKKRAGTLLPAPFSSPAKPLVICWVRSPAWAHKLTWTWWPRFLTLPLLGDLAGSRTITRRARAIRVSERRKGAQRQGHYQEGH